MAACLTEVCKPKLRYVLAFRESGLALDPTAILHEFVSRTMQFLHPELGPSLRRPPTGAAGLKETVRH